MPSFFGKQQFSSEQTSDRYLYINNCGFQEGISQMRVRRPKGRVDYQLIYIKQGQLFCELPEGPVTLRKGNVFLYRPGVPQLYSTAGNPVTFFWIHFTGSAVEDILTFFQGNILIAGDFPEFERFCREYYMEHRLSVRSSELRYEGELICLLAKMADRADGKLQQQLHTRISSALMAMNQSQSPRLSNEELAALCGLNVSYFIKLFKRITAVTPQQYYTGLILDKAKELLEQTDLSVGQIAAMCGIEDSLYFSRLFKKHTGTSPSRYRKGI